MRKKMLLANRKSNVCALTLMLALATFVGLHAQEPGELARIHVAEVERVPVFTNDGEIMIVTLRIRWQIHDLDQFLANVPNMELAKEYIMIFSEPRLSDWLSEFDYATLVENIPTEHPVEETTGTYDEIVDTFVETVNAEDMLLESRGMRIHSIDVIVYS